MIKILCAIADTFFSFVNRFYRFKKRTSLLGIVENQQDELIPLIPPPLDDDEWLLRLHFSPIHVNNNLLVSSAISTEDLKSRGFSVDRESIVNPEIIKSRATEQSTRKPEDRKTPYISRFSCDSVRRLKYENEDAFLIIESPKYDNPAHAHILSAQPLGKSGLKKLKNLLLEELQKDLMSLDQFIPQIDR